MSLSYEKQSTIHVGRVINSFLGNCIWLAEVRDDAGMV